MTKLSLLSPLVVMEVTDLSLLYMDGSDRSDNSVTTLEKLIFGPFIDEWTASFLYQSESNLICQLCTKIQGISYGAFFMVNKYLTFAQFCPKKHMQK